MLLSFVTPVSVVETGSDVLVANVEGAGGVAGVVVDETGDVGRDASSVSLPPASIVCSSVCDEDKAMLLKQSKSKMLLTYAF